MPNRLANENSPYLLQHAHNPVDWYPWCEEALEKARQEDKPIFLSIGYAACHWCHVMAHESFEDPETATIMNQFFVNIKVDREERPDLDSIYMQAVVSMTGQGGWPLSVFLTPEGKPFFGGTYYPPIQRYNMPSFQSVLFNVHNVWVKDRIQILNISQQITAHLNQSATMGESSPEIRPDSLEKAAFTLAQSYDWKNGGWGSAPKFPQPMAIEFLLRRASSGDHLALEMASHSLRAMSKGGMYDVVGGGFARYSTDNEWRVPHFEKMLYDNALLSQVYLHAYMVSGEPDLRRVCEATLDFITRELTHPMGGFFSSIDADSEGREGKYYLWTPAAIQEAITQPEDAEFFMAAYQVTEKGNFEGANVLQRVLGDDTLAENFNLSREDVLERLARLHSLLLAARQKRIRPTTDDKVLVAWNALALVSFSEAGRYLRRADYVDVAIRNARFLLGDLHPGDRLLRSWRDGRAQHNAYLEDYAGLIIALLSLYQTDPDIYWFASANQLLDEMLQHFPDPEGGFFDTRDDHDPLLTRPKDQQDNATPCGNSQAAMALLQLSTYTARNDLRVTAERSLYSIQDLAIRYPTSFSNWLCAIDFASNPVAEVAIITPGKDDSTQALVAVLWEKYRPRLVSAFATIPFPPDIPPLLFDRSIIEGKPTAYVCQNFICKRPVTEAEELRSQLDLGS